MKSKINSLNKARLKQIRKEFKIINELIINLEPVLSQAKEIREKLNKESLKLLKQIEKE